MTSSSNNGKRASLGSQTRSASANDLSQVEKGSVRSVTTHTPPTPVVDTSTEMVVSREKVDAKSKEQLLLPEGLNREVKFNDVLRSMHPSPLLPAPGRYNGYSQGITNISCYTTWEFDCVVFSWKIEHFSAFRNIAKEKGLPSEGDVLSTPPYRDNMEGDWWLRLYPFERREKHLGQVSIFLHTTRAKKGPVFFAMHFTAVGPDGREVAETMGGCQLHKFDMCDSVRNFGFYDFIPNEEAVAKCIHDDGSIHVRCEVRIFTRSCTVVDGRIEASNK